MTWDPVSERLWKVLEAKPPKWGTYYASEVRAGQAGALLAQDAVTGSRHLLMRVGNESEVHADASSRGVKLQLRRLEGADGGLFADFWCADPAKDKLFGVMVDEVLGRWAAHEGTGPMIAGRVLKAWRTLLSSENNKFLSVPEQAGLFGELLFLEGLCDLNPHALDCWRGPDGHQQDFVTEHWIAEVKSSLNHSSVFVHGANQLDVDASSRLVLAVFLLALSPNGRTLGDQVQRVREKLGGADLERKLALVRYRDSDVGYYAETRFEVVSVNQYEVKDPFPRITRRGMRAQFDDSAITTLNYELQLGALGVYRVDSLEIEHFPKLEGTQA